jgi:hypothetical protein
MTSTLQIVTVLQVTTAAGSPIAVFAAACSASLVDVQVHLSAGLCRNFELQVRLKFVNFELLVGPSRLQSAIRQKSRSFNFNRTLPPPSRIAV